LFDVAVIWYDVAAGIVIKVENDWSDWQASSGNATLINTSYNALLLLTLSMS